MKRKLLRIGGIILLLIVLVIGGGYTYMHTAYPKDGPLKQITIPSDPESVEKGKYLATHVAGCIDCHSPRRIDIFSAPVEWDNIGKGGIKFSRDLGFPGEFYPPNLTPAALADWSDAEVFHAVTTGVSKDGRVLFPIMPYNHYRYLDEEDLKDILAYIRTLKPIENKVPEPQIDFPVNILIRQVPAPAAHGKWPPETEVAKYGKYLFTMAACDDCHTPQVKGKPEEGKFLAGGFTFNVKGIGTIRTANITPDNETGIGSWTEDQFVKRFKFYTDPANIKPWKEVGYQTIMPWELYGGMKESDLRAIFKYLRTIQPVKNKVVHFTQETTGVGQSH